MKLFSKERALAEPFSSAEVLDVSVAESVPLLNLQVYLGMQRKKLGYDVMEPVLLDCTVKLFAMLCLERTLESAELGPLSYPPSFHRLLS